MQKYRKTQKAWQNSVEQENEFSYIQPLEAKPLEVKVNNDFDRAFKTFRAIVQKERILSTYKDKSRYEKPSDRKRRKRNEMKRKMMELEAKDKEMLEMDQKLKMQERKAKNG